VGGTFFLPYQLAYTAEQLRRSYPAIKEFLAAKREYDPSGLLSSAFYAKYAPLVSD
jgi:FAD/FMN-containing dehydrogenase